MKKKLRVIFIIVLAIIVLVAAGLAVYYLVERNRMARSLSQETAELIKQIQEYSFEDIKSCQELVDDCNQAISGKNLKKSKALLIKVDEKKAELDKLYQSINIAVEKKKTYESFSDQAFRLQFLRDFPSEDYEYQMNKLEAGLNSKDRDQIDSAVNVLDQITAAANKQLKTAAEQWGKGFLAAEVPEGNEGELSLINIWKAEVSQALLERDYVTACQLARRGQQFIEISKEQEWTEIRATDLKIESGQEGKLLVRIPQEIPPLEHWMKPENCLLLEQRQDDAEYALCDVIDIRREEQKPFLGWHFLTYVYIENLSPNGAWGSIVLPREKLTDMLDKINDSDFEVEDITGGFYDVLYQIIEQAAWQKAQSTVTAVIMTTDLGNSSVGMQECIDLAKSNDIAVWTIGIQIFDNYIDNKSFEELDLLASETGGKYLEMENYKNIDAMMIDLVEMVKNLYQEQMYSITYRTSGGTDKKRKITLNYPGEHNLRCEYDYNPFLVQEKTEIPSTQNSKKVQQPQEIPNSNVGENDYIIPDSDSRYLTETDLSVLDAEKRRLARNEIYARHGRRFTTPEIQEYFMQKAWYHPTVEPGAFREEVLNIYEKANVKFIAEYESGLEYQGEDD